MKIITNDWKLKLVAFILALLLWGYIQGEVNPIIKQNFTIPLEIRNIEQGQTVELSANQIAVTVKGSKILQDKLIDENIKAYIDMKEVKDSNKTKIALVHIDVDKKFKSMDFTPRPKNVEVKIAPTSNKYMTIDIQYDTPPQLGTYYEKKSLSKSNAMISGPTDKINNVFKIVAKVKDVPISGFNGYLELFPIDKDNNIVPDITIEPHTINAVIGIKSVNIPVNKRVIVVPKVMGKIDSHYVVESIECSPSEVIIQGSQDELKNINTIETDIIPLNTITENYNKKVNLLFTGNITSQTKDVEVNVKVKKIK